eukprot:scaffold2392_cov72-Phaeocystis_antarctica.AAC.2
MSQPCARKTNGQTGERAKVMQHIMDRTSAPRGSGALHDISRTVQRANTPGLQPGSRTRWCWSALPCPRYRVPRPVSQTAERVTFYRGDGENFRESSRCKHT